MVLPILVIQVEDGTDKALTKTDLGICLETLESAIGRRLREGEVAHTFNETETLTLTGAGSINSTHLSPCLLLLPVCFRPSRAWREWR